MRSSFVRLIFARARYGKLDQGRGDRRDDQHQEADQPSSSASIAAVTTSEKEAKARNHGDRAGDRGRDGADKDVAVVHVAEFVGEDAFEFFVIQKLEDSMR